MSRALVSGAAGFIGGHLCEKLLRDGVEVHGLTRRDPPEDGGGITWHRADLADADAARALMRAVRPDTFFHLASHVAGTRDLAAVAPTFRDNLAGTVSALTAIAEAGGARCVLAGSLEEPDIGAGETMPSSPYAAAKAAQRLYANLFSELYGLEITTARIFMVYGPRQYDVKKLIPYTIRALLAGERPSFTSGVRPVDWAYVEDVAAGLIAAARAPQAGGRIVDLGSGALVTVRAVVETIARDLGREDAIAFGDVAERPMEQVRKADVAASAQAIGWRPATPLDAGLRRTIDFYRDNPGFPGDTGRG